MSLLRWLIDGPAPPPVTDPKLPSPIGWKRNLWWYTIGWLICEIEWRRMSWWEQAGVVTEEFTRAAEEARRKEKDE